MQVVVDSALLHRAQIEAPLFQLVFFALQNGGKIAAPMHTPMRAYAVWFGGGYANDEIIRCQFPWTGIESVYEIATYSNWLRLRFQDVADVCLDALENYRILVPINGITEPILNRCVEIGDSTGGLACKNQIDASLLYNHRFTRPDQLLEYSTTPHCQR